MLTYALVTTFLLGALIGSFATIYIIVKLDDRDKAKTAKALEKAQDQAIKNVGPNPLPVS